MEYFAAMLGIADEGAIADAYQATARLYHQAEGRWVSPDPAGLEAVDLTNPQSWNRYAYVLNNPLTWTDPAGLEIQMGVDGCTWDTVAETLDCPLPGAVSSIFSIFQTGSSYGGGRVGAGAPSNFHRMPLPGNHLNCTTSTGTSFPAPPGFSVSKIAANGAANGLLGAGAAVEQGGYYDFQRFKIGSVTQFFPGYTPVANVAVGAYVQGTGAPQWVASLISNTYAFLYSSNGATSQQAQFRSLGFSLAAGKGTYSCQPSIP